MEKYLKAKAKYEAINQKQNILDYDSQKEHRVDTDVGNGCWVLVIQNIPVGPKPILFGIYWGVPNYDEFGRQTCKIRTSEDIVLLNHEFTVISEQRLQEYRLYGWELSNTLNTSEHHQQMSIQLVEKGKDLCMEEREVIMSLMLDGLTESKACEEYFLARHTDESNYTICYMPSKSVRAELNLTFGNR